MYKLRSQKQKKYFAEVIRLHYEEGFIADRIAQILPIGHATASRWIAIFAAEKGKLSGANMKEDRSKVQDQGQEEGADNPQEVIKELKAKLLQAEIKNELYEEIIKIAEAKYNIPIRKKAGAKQ